MRGDEDPLQPPRVYATRMASPDSNLSTHKPRGKQGKKRLQRPHRREQRKRREGAADPLRLQRA